jgi:hypothetical protein
MVKIGQEMLTDIIAAYVNTDSTRAVNLWYRDDATNKNYVYLIRCVRSLLERNRSQGCKNKQTVWFYTEAIYDSLFVLNPLFQHPHYFAGRSERPNSNRRFSGGHAVYGNGGPDIQRQIHKQGPCARNDRQR